MLLSTPNSSVDAPPPLVSVVVPTRGRQHVLADLFRSLASQTVPVDRFEVIVVDDGGAAGGLAEIASPFHALMQLTLMRQDPHGPGEARNAGAAVARGSYLVFTADDCQPSADWLATIERRLLTNPGAMVGGRVVNGLPDDPFATSSAVLIDYLDRCRDSQATDAPFFTPNNLAVPRDLFLDLGGFDASMGATGEDRDFCDRWIERGLPIITAPEVLVRHMHAHDLWSFWLQHVSYGRGSRRFYRSRAARGVARASGRVTPEPLSFYVNLIRYPLSRFSGPRAWLQSALMMLAQVANLAGFLLESRRPTPVNGPPR